LLLLLLLLPAGSQRVMLAGVSATHHLLAGVALHKKDAERSLQDIETTLLVCAQQCALDDEEEVSMLYVWSSVFPWRLQVCVLSSFSLPAWPRPWPGDT
jgi:hypothetical protein